MSFKTIKLKYILGVWLVFLCALPAYAAKVETPTYALEAIVVSAEKQKADAQKVPVSMDVLSAQQIEDSGIETIQDAARKIPNLSLTSWGTRGNAQFFVRGLGSVENTPAVGFYVDDVGYLDARIFDSPLYEIERIEFLRGPQGTLYGRNTLGGVINVVTKKPDNDVDVGIKGTYGSFDTFDVTAYLRAPLIEDKLYIGLSGSIGGSQGYYTNTFYDKEFVKQEDYSGRLQLRFTPTDKWDILLSADVEHIKDDAYPITLREAQTSWNPNVSQLLSSYKNNKDDPYEINHDFKDSSQRDSLGASLRINYKAPWFNVTSITGFRHFTTENNNDQDFGPYDVFVYKEDYQSDYFTQELRLSSPEDTNSPLKWVGGVFLSSQVTRRDGSQNMGADLPYVVLGKPTWDGLQAAGAGALIPYPTLPFDIPGLGAAGDPNPLHSFDASNGGIGYSSIEKSTTVLNTYAIFGQGTYTFFDKLDLTIGLRYEYEQGFFHNTIENKFSGVQYNSYNNTMNNSVLLPKFGLAYHWTDDIMTYVSVSRGYRGGGFNYTSPTKVDSTYDPEYNWTYEFGFKTSFFNDRLRINGSVFYMDIQDQQVTQILSGGSGLRIDNAARARSLGFELEVAALLAEGLLFEGSFGYTDSKFLEFKKTDYFQGALVTRDFEGKATPLMPEYTYSLALQYSLPIYTFKKANGKDEGTITWVTRAEVDGFGKTYYSEDNSIVQDPYALVNLRTGFETENYSVTFWVNNVFNTKYSAFAFYSDQIGVLAQMGEPTSFGVTFKAEW